MQPRILTEVAHTPLCNECGGDMKRHAPRNSSRGLVTTLVLEDTIEGRERNVHCIGCGFVIFHYHGAFKIIIKGEFQESLRVSRPIDLMCNKCKMLYRIV